MITAEEIQRIKLTKRQDKLLREMYRHKYSEFGKAVEWRGKYYWGYYEIGSRPTGTKTLDELVKIGLVTFVNCIGGHYRLAEKDGVILCEKLIPKDNSDN